MGRTSYTQACASLHRQRNLNKRTRKWISWYEEQSRKKHKERQEDLMKETFAKNKITFHFIKRLRERFASKPETLAKDFAKAVKNKAIKYCTIGKVFKVYWSKWRYILWEDMSLITTYDIDKKKEKRHNQVHDRVNLDEWQYYRIKSTFIPYM